MINDGAVAAALSCVVVAIFTTLAMVELTRKLAAFHAQKAVDAICRVAPDSEARDALISICYVVLSRSK